MDVKHCGEVGVGGVIEPFDANLYDVKASSIDDQAGDNSYSSEDYDATTAMGDVAEAGIARSLGQAKADRAAAVACGATTFVVGDVPRVISGRIGWVDQATTY